jgi:toxin ParE1/3/4
MTRDGLFYELSSEADSDIENIFVYTLKEFGLEQAVDYISQFEKSFVQVLDNPKSGRARSEIRKGLRSIGQNTHVIFYRILKDRIRIVRILHGSRDLSSFLF